MLPLNLQLSFVSLFIVLINHPIAAPDHRNDELTKTRK